MDLVQEHLITVDNIPWENEQGITCMVARWDKVHPSISGNKWYKLRFYLSDAIEKNNKTIATFGGAFSNHIAATAVAASLCGLRSVGFIRGEAPVTPSHTLAQAAAAGMELIYLPRSEYALKKIPPHIETRDFYIINEGGYGPKGAAGAATAPIPGADYICCAVGTGTTMAGIINAHPCKKIMGISVLKNYKTHEAEIQQLLKNPDADFTIYHDYHFGGYAKKNDALLQFMNALYAQTRIPTDFVYTGKLFYAVKNLIENNVFPPGSKVAIIHSGGLQGNRSLPPGTLIF